MQETLQNSIKEKKISKMDVVIYYLLDSSGRFITAEQVKFSLGFARDKVYESLKRLHENELIEKTDEHPARYYVKDE